MKTLKVMAALLDYPGEALLEAWPELSEALSSEQTFSPGLAELISEIEASDIYDLQEHYVDLFDRVPSLSLHLFEHVHGQTRDRGAAMVELTGLYAQSGFRLRPGELPDYLPAFLEYLSCIDADGARTLLADAADVLRSIGARLEKRGSRYAAVFEALLAACGERTWARDAVSDRDIRAEDDPATLDAAWAEEPAFGAPPPSCGAAARRPHVAAARVERPDMDSKTGNRGLSPIV
jgi:nitrate reductase delta subunit